MRIGGEQAVYLSQQDQEFGVYQVGDHGRQGVVVPEDVALQLVHGDHVVLVDDGHHAKLEERQQGVAHVQVTQSLGEVLAGEKRLGRSSSSVSTPARWSCEICSTSVAIT